MPDFARDKAQATQWAQQLLGRNDWVILDTETTGLHGAEVVDIAIISPQGQLYMAKTFGGQPSSARRLPCNPKSHSRNGRNSMRFSQFP